MMQRTLLSRRSNHIRQFLARFTLSLTLVVLSLLLSPGLVHSQEVEQPGEDLTIFTRYPAQMSEIGESVTFALTLRVGGDSARIVDLAVEQIPEGWSATFLGDGRVVRSVYVEPGQDASVSLKLDPPAEVAPDAYRFRVVGRSSDLRSELPLELNVQEKLPSRLSFDVELPTLKGSPSSTFRYDIGLKNEGEEEMTVNLQPLAPEGFQVKFSLSGQEVTSFPIGANETKRLAVEVTPQQQVAAGQYQVIVQAQAGDVQEALPLIAEVTGQASLSLTTPDERLSGEAYAGEATPFNIVVSNSGSAPARDVKLSATEPNGWSVRFEPEQIGELAPGQQAEVTAHVLPAEKAIAGDYMVVVSGQAEGVSSQSVDLRVTVLTSTLWGIVGVVVIAAAVGVVGMAVARFGRR